MNTQQKSWLLATPNLHSVKDADFPKELDVVLVTHPRDEKDLSRAIPWIDKLTLEERQSLLTFIKPIFGEVIKTEKINIGILFLPAVAEKMMNPSTRGDVRKLLQKDGLDVLASAKTKLLCLGGLTGSLTKYGKALKKFADVNNIKITTGHALTGISVHRAYMRAVQELELNMAEEGVTVLGVGSVGTSFSRLLAHKGPKPKSLVLIDRENRKEDLEIFAEELKAIGNFEIEIETTEADGNLKKNSLLYNSRVIISAVSSANVIDISSLPPNKVLIDDSQPYCWSREEAWKRCQTQKDIVPCEAGLIDCSSIGYNSHFPFDFANHDENGTNIAWCCMAEGLLYHLDGNLPTTAGMPSLEQILLYDQAFDKFGLGCPPLQCSRHVLPIEELKANFYKELAY